MYMPLEVGDVVVDGWMLVMELAGGGSRLVLVDCWPEAAYDSIIHEEEEQEEEHGSSKFVVVVVVPVEDEIMAADRNKQHCLVGEEGRDGRLHVVLEAADQNCICVEEFEADGGSSSGWELLEDEHEELGW